MSSRNIIQDDEDSGFLPKNIIPLHYQLTFAPNLSEGYFFGSTSIIIRAQEDSDDIAINTLDLQILSIRLDNKLAQNVGGTLASSYDEKSQQTRIALTDSLKKDDEATLTITFKGALNDQFAGFYRSNYVGEDGKEKWVASTQMQPSSARRAFPCFDEPSFKAQFSIKVLVEQHLICISNMPAVQETKVSFTIKEITFATTPLMSSYLVAMVVGEGLYAVRNNEYRVPITSYVASAADARNAVFSTALTAKCMALYEEAFDFRFPLPKLDMAAIPYFQLGAMENWGLIQFDTIAFLYDSTQDSEQRKQSIAEVVAHEVGHQWLGCLVTTQSWAATWLNEGFATWVSKFALSQLYPDWNIWDGFVAGDLQSGLGLDSLRHSHPIEVPIKAGQEVDVLDAIAYQKGSSIIRMTADYLGEKTFMKGIQRLIKEFAFQNVTTSDLWGALSEASGIDVTAFADPWVRKTGFPVVTVLEDHHRRIFTLKQSRFLRSGDAGLLEDRTTWQIPLNIRSTDTFDHKAILKTRHQTRVLDMEFFKLNADQIGFYRTSYTPQRLELLSMAAKSGLLTVQDRIGLIADTGALAPAGYQGSPTFLKLIYDLRTEDDLNVWRTISVQLNTFRDAWVFQPWYTQIALDAYTRHLVEPSLSKIGWTPKEDDDDLTKQLKPLLFQLAGMAGEEEIVDFCKKTFREDDGKGLKDVHPSIRDSVYAIGLKNTGGDEFEALVKLYLDPATRPSVEASAYAALGFASTDALLAKALSFALSDSVPPSMAFRLLPGFVSSAAGVHALWTWLQDGWDAISEKAPWGLAGLGRVVDGVVKNLNKAELIEEAKKFFKGKDTFGYQLGLGQAVEVAESNIKWVERDRLDVEKFLDNYWDGNNARNKIDVGESDRLRIDLRARSGIDRDERAWNARSWGPRESCWGEEYRP